MAFIRFLLLLSIIVMVNCAYAEDKINIAYLKEGLKDLNKAEKLIALQMWSEDVARINHVPAEIRSYDSMSELLSDIQLKQIHFALMNTGNYLMYQKQLLPFLSSDIYATLRTEEIYESFIVLVNKKSSINALDDLKNKRFSIVEDYIIQHRYLEYLTKNINRQSPAQYFKLLKTRPSENQALLDVFFGVSDGCIVAQHFYKMAIELNPTLADQLNVIINSGPVFIPAILIAFNYDTENIREKFGKNLLDAQFTARGREILDLFKINRIVRVDAEQLKPMFVFFEQKPD